MFIACLVMLVMDTADQLRAFNRDVDVPVPKPARKAAGSGSHYVNVNINKIDYVDSPSSLR